MEKWSSQTFDPKEQSRETVRWESHDYRMPGYYYLTINCDAGIHFFGEVINDEMVLSPQGRIADEFMQEISNKLKSVEDVTYVVMPHHIHLVFYLKNDEYDANHCYTLANGEEMDTMREVRKHENQTGTVSSIVRSIKSGISRKCHQAQLEMKWHTRFYDHVVRNTEERLAIIKYIEENPVHWKYPKDKNPLGLAF